MATEEMCLQKANFVERASLVARSFLQSLGTALISIKKQGTVGGVAQVVEHLPSKCEASTIQKKKSKTKQNPRQILGMVVHICNPSYSGSKGRRSFSLRLAWANLVRPYQK
jgi:hypothetical protein